MAYGDLSICYRDGIGVRPDPELAEKYKKLAADAGYPLVEENK